MRLRSIRRPHHVVGLAVGIGIVETCALYFFWVVGLGYDGKCGMGIIWGSGRTPCSFAESMWEATLIGLSIVYSGWWVVLIVILLPVIIGHLIGRRRTTLE